MRSNTEATTGMEIRRSVAHAQRWRAAHCPEVRSPQGGEPRMPVRLKDIARELGLSVVTISKVLRNHPDIAEKTRYRVLRRMEELKYRPNLAARSLSTGRTSTAGLVVPDLLHPFFARIATTISAEVRKQGYGLIISS